MDTTLTNLSFVLNELGVGTTINTLDERVTVQKAVYLAQAVGVPLRYSYSWYIRGPYSRDLTKDYYALNEYAVDKSGTANNQTIREPFASALTKLRTTMLAPEGVPLNQRDWLELLSSVHYLRTSAGLDVAMAKQRLEIEKPSLACYSDCATQFLVQLEIL